MLHPGIRGHEALRHRLRQRLEAGRLPGALLLVGPEGIGKRRVALELAMRELCFRRTACGACAGCQSFDADPLPVEWPNLLRIAPEGKAGLIRIGAIREDDLVEGGVIRWAHQAPPMGCHRWILIEDAHRLHGASANMLLKTLEEPPEGCHFLLVTHRPEAVLQTIRSRAERWLLQALTEPEAWSIAQHAGWEAADRPCWSALAQGTLRYLDPGDFQRAVALLEAWLEVLQGRGVSSVLGILMPDRTSSRAQGEQLAQCLEMLQLLLGDLGRYAAGHALRLEPWAEAITAAGRVHSLRAGVLDTVCRLMRHLPRNPQPEALLREVAAALG